MLSLAHGRPLAIINGGEYDGEIIRVDLEHPTEKVESKFGGCDSDCCSKCSQRCLNNPCCDYCSIYYEFSDDGESEDEYNEDEDFGNRFTTDGKLYQIPNIDTREVVYVAGPSGSGKSTYVSYYIKNYAELFPDKDIFLFSRKDTDPVLDKIKNLHRIEINEELIKDPIDVVKELPSGGLICFDDVNTIQDDKLRKQISKLKNDILEIARANNVYCIITSHLVIPDEKKDARIIMNELHTFTCFPKSGSQYQIDYVLKKYFGLSPLTISAIMHAPSRWVTIYRSYPQIVMHEHGVHIL